jgi:protein ImuB
LPELRIELVEAELARGEPAAREGGDVPTSRAPLAVVVAPPPMMEAKLLGNTRLSVVSREARALGVLPGQTIAQARARAGDLEVRVVRPEAVRNVLARIAEIGLAFGATVSFGMEGEPAFDAAHDFGDVVWIDITGCAHLHAPHARSAAALFDGETVLASRLAGVIASLGHTCSVAIADGPRVAAMLARDAAERALHVSSRRRSRASSGSLLLLDPIVVPSGENARALANLPIAALPLPPEDVRWLAKIGIRTIQELRELPPQGLGTRLGGRAREVMALAAGEDRAPLTPYLPPEVPEEEAELEYGIEGTQALTFVAKTLTDRLATRLQGRAVAASRLELELRLDAAMLRERRDAAESPKRSAGRESSPRRALQDAVTLVALDLPAPLARASDLFAALRPKIERLVLDAPVLGARLRSPVLVHQRALPLSLFEPQPKAERALPRLVAELTADLGPEAVCTLVLGDSWVPEDRSKLVTFGTTAAGGRSDGAKRRRHLLSSAPEPTRLLAEPQPVSREGVRVTRHLARLESVEWWKEPPSDRPPGSARRAFDYVHAWTDDGAVWVEIDRATSAMRVRGLFD